jgi:PAS domain S-box-containing protein
MPNHTQNSLNQGSTLRLPRSLSPLETWGFGLTGNLSWISVAPAMHEVLGPQAILVWLPGVIVGILLNLQVKRLGEHWPEMSGGTPNYATRLLRSYPGLGRYGAIAYFFSWATVPPVYALILTDLIKATLDPLGIPYPETALKVGFTVIAFVMAFSGTRALSILHLCFVLPAVGFLLIFCIQGIGWLALSPASPGFLPSGWSSLSLTDWAKWYFFAIYGTCSCECASSFAADSRHPLKTLRFLSFAAWLIPIVYLGGSWVLMRLATEPSLDDSAFLNLIAAATPFWGKSAIYLITLLLVSGCLLSSATAVANCPRILYQLALDEHLSPVFAVVTKRKILEPGLILTLLIGLLCLAWGDLTNLVIVSATTYVTAIMAVHLGLWLGRDRTAVRWPWWSLSFFLIEAVVLIMGGLSWNWHYLLLGLIIPLAILAADAVMRRLRFPLFDPAWWMRRYQNQSGIQIKDFVPLQVGILILLLCSATTITWAIRSKLEKVPGNAGNNLLIVLLLTTAFVGVAIACWTSLPQVAAIAEARKQSEHLFLMALDAIVVLDENGAIRQANPATEQLFGMNPSQLVGSHLSQLLPELVGQPEYWSSRSEQSLIPNDQNPATVEVTVSARSNRRLQAEYVVILRDISQRKQAEEALQKAKEELEIKVTERTTELKSANQQLESEIAERKHIEENLQQSQAMLRLVINNIPQFICWKDRNSVYLGCNRSCADLAGVANPEQIIGKTDYDLPWRPEEADFFQTCDRRVMETDTPEYHIIEPIHQADGTQIWLDTSKIPLHDAAGHVMGVLVTIEDITDRRRSEEEIHKTLEKEKELSDLKSRFITTTSHEFRTPLSIISSSAGLLEDYAHRLDEAKKLKHLQRIQAAVTYMTELLEDVLLINRVEAGKLGFNPIPLDWVEFCCELVEELQLGIHTNHTIALQIDPAAALNPKAETDEKLLRQILSNLLSNAVKYSPTGSTVHFHLAYQDGAAIFQIKDAGIGIPLEDQVHLFESFHRAQNVGNISGTGLGLAIVKKCVEVHGGKIAVTSESGVGTTFTVQLPCSASSSKTFSE